MADLEEQKRYQELQRADQAKAILENPLLASAFADVEREILAMKENTHDKEAVQKLHFMFVCNRKVQNILRSYIETGKMAAIQLEEKRKFNLLKWGTN
jgi:hypothetical protein